MSYIIKHPKIRFFLKNITFVYKNLIVYFNTFSAKSFYIYIKIKKMKSEQSSQNVVENGLS